MPKNKLKRILALPSFDNVIDNPSHFKGEWNVVYFHNNNPITLELGCGKGDYVIELAQKFPDQNFIGMDLKGARLYIGAKRCEELHLDNVGFIQTNIEDIEDIFEKDEVQNIWITFPDPYPKKARANKRLTSLKFINLYRKVLVPNGTIFFKTDDENLYKFSLEILEKENCTIQKNSADIYNNENLDGLIKFQTTYETKHLKAGKKIKYIEFQL